ncbi:MAG: extracellular solute-binding protein [Gammaproteobacteria bacterium]|nr:extracellular solute-binding protein [Gammaproteobacteria bacterium]
MEGKMVTLMAICLVVGAGIGVGASYFAWGSDGNGDSGIECIAIKVDGVVLSSENVLNDTYEIQRNLILATDGAPTGLALDFMNWILSAEGQAIVADEGFVALTAQDYTTTSQSGELNVAGSTTIQPVMVKFVEAYEAKHPGVTINVTGGGSGAGATSVMNGTADIGMLSRDLKSSESALTATTIAKDGVVLAVDAAAGVTDLTIDQIAEIFNGDITNWSEVGGKDLEIAPIIREDGSGTRETFDAKMAASLGISVADFGENMMGYSATNSTGAMLGLCKSIGGSIGYVNLGSMSDL